MKIIISDINYHSLSNLFKMGLCNTKPSTVSAPKFYRVELYELTCKTIKELDTAISEYCATNGNTFHRVATYEVQFEQPCFNGCQHGEGWSECSFTRVANNVESVREILSRVSFNQEALTATITGCDIIVS